MEWISRTCASSLPSIIPGSLHGTPVHTFFHYLCIAFSFASLSSYVSPDLNQLSKLPLRLGFLKSGGLLTIPFLLIASDFHQLGIFYLLHIFDMPFRCAVSGPIQEVISHGLCSRHSFHYEYSLTGVPTHSSCLEDVFPGLPLHPHR